MKSIWVFLACLAVCPLAAETIGHVEYQLPDQSWKVGNEFSSDKKPKSKTIIYIPGDATKEDSQEFFSVHVNDMSTGPLNQETLEQTFEKLFTDKQTRVKILEQNQESILYEWAVLEDGQELLHGWTRGFSSPNGTVLLSYQTEKIDQVNTVRPIWIKRLKEAKAIN